MIRRFRSFLRPWIVAPALAGLALGLGGCPDGGGGGSGGGGGDGDDAQVVHIAVCGPMTGSAAAFGEMIKNAAKLMEKEVNDAGGIDVGGRKMKIDAEIFDDKGDITEATNVSRKVAGDDSISIVIGHFNSVCSNNAKEEYDRAKLPAMSPGSTNVKVCKGYPYMFRNLYRDDFQGQQIADYLKGKVGVSSVAVIFDNDDYGKGLMQAFKARAEKIGMKVAEPIPYLRERTQDFKPLVQQAKAAGVEAIFVAGLYNEAALITKAARGDLNMTIPILGGDGVMSPTFISNAGESAEGALVVTPFLFNSGDDSDVAKKFLSNFTASYSKEPDTWAALTYDAMGLALDTISKVGTDRQAIRDHLASIQDASAGYTGVTGVTYFDAEGDCYSKPIYVAVVKDGKFVPAEKQMK
jgi:branched-chain amino acid transport system substrate-binding protein